MVQTISSKCSQCDQAFLSQKIQIPQNAFALFHKECWNPGPPIISFLGNGQGVQSFLMTNQLTVESVDPQGKRIIEYIIAVNSQVGEATVRL
jgi:hypothetical protein